MADVISSADLTAYPGVKKVADETLALILDLTNGVVGEVRVGNAYLRDLSPMPARARSVALEVAARVLRNPENAESVTTGIDDWKKTIRHRLPELADEAGVYLTGPQLDVLRGLLYDTLPGPPRVKTIRLGVPGYGTGF